METRQANQHTPDIRADESVAEALLEVVTELLAKASSKQLTPPKANEENEYASNNR